MTIQNPLEVLKELKKYMQIVDLAKQAIGRNSKGLPVDDLHSQLAKKLDECAFTKAYSNSQPTLPLHSATAYLKDLKTLERQAMEADAYIKQVIQTIQEDVGPFYSKSEVMATKEKYDERNLEQVWLPTLEPITVKTYWDENKKVYIQADWNHGQYRTAKDQDNYGPWKFFTT